MIKDEFALPTSKVVKTSESKDRSTTKMMIELQDGKRIETVIMRYGTVQVGKTSPVLFSNSDIKANRHLCCSDHFTVLFSWPISLKIG